VAAQDLMPVKGKIFTCSPMCTDALWGLRSLLLNPTGERDWAYEPKHSPHLVPRIKCECNFMFILPYSFMLWTWTVSFILCSWTTFFL